VVKEVQGERVEMEVALWRIFLEEVSVTRWEWKVCFGGFNKEGLR
jgi:hypothetical protein